MKAKLGDIYTDTVTGFTGTATARMEEYLDEPSVRLVAKTGNDDLKERWVTEGRLVPSDDRYQGFGSR